MINPPARPYAWSLRTGGSRHIGARVIQPALESICTIAHLRRHFRGELRYGTERSFESRVLVAWSLGPHYAKYAPATKEPPVFIVKSCCYTHDQAPPFVPFYSPPQKILIGLPALEPIASLGLARLRFPVGDFQPVVGVFGSGGAAKI